MSNTSKGKYERQFGIIANSGVGVIMTHTREPHRVAETLFEWSFANGVQFREWDCVYGWKTYDMADPSAKPTWDKSIEPHTALKRIADIDGNGKAAWDSGVFVVHYPHWTIPKSANYIQMILNYSREFSTKTCQRLVLVVPEGYQLPRELESAVVVLDFDLPTKEELLEIYNFTMEPILSKKGLKLASFYTPAEVQRILSLGSGMTEAEFSTTISRAVVTNKDKFPNIPIDDFCNVLKESKTEMVKRSECLELMPSAKIEEIGGLENAKEWIMERCNCFTQEARDFGVDMPKGIVAIGPPGTGKSLLGKAVGSVLNLPVVRFDIGAVFNSLIGESEARVRAVLKLLKAMAPIVCIVDEVDKMGMGPETSSGDGGVGKRVMGNILTFIQEDESGIFWVLTANRAKGLDSALVRKGRMDEVFSVLAPNDTERLEVLRIHLRKRKQNPDLVENLHAAVAGSKGFVASEIEAAVKEAVNKAYNTGCEVTGDLIAAQLSNMKPLSVAFKDDYDYMVQWAENNARPSSKEIVLKPTTPRSRVPAAAARGAGVTV